MEAQEKVFYQDSIIQVSNSRLMIGSQMYPIRNISFVGMGTIEPKRFWANFLIGWGIICILAGVFFGGIILIGIGVAMYFLQKPNYIVNIQSNSGMVEAYKSQDRIYIQTIVEALNEAIVHRG